MPSTLTSWFAPLISSSRSSRSTSRNVKSKPLQFVNNHISRTRKSGACSLFFASFLGPVCVHLRSWILIRKESMKSRWSFEKIQSFFHLRQKTLCYRTGKHHLAGSTWCLCSHCEIYIDPTDATGKFVDDWN